MPFPPTPSPGVNSHRGVNRQTGQINSGTPNPGTNSPPGGRIISRWGRNGRAGPVPSLWRRRRLRGRRRFVLIWRNGARSLAVLARYGMRLPKPPAWLPARGSRVYALPLCSPPRSREDESNRGAVNRVPAASKGGGSPEPGHSPGARSRARSVARILGGFLRSRQPAPALCSTAPAAPGKPIPGRLRSLSHASGPPALTGSCGNAAGF